MAGIWGDHLQHGMYFVDDPSHQEKQKAFASLPRAAQIRTIHAAQIRTIDEALRFAAISGSALSPHNATFGYHAYCIHTKKGRGIEAMRTMEEAELKKGVAEFTMSHLGLSRVSGETICTMESTSSTTRLIRRSRRHSHLYLELLRCAPSRLLRCAPLMRLSVSLPFQVFFQVTDALEQPFPDGQFDLVWSLECGEHIHDKRKFVSELARVAAPGATIIIVTWCHKDLSPSEESLKSEEKKLLKKICDAYYLNMCSAADYVQLLESLSLQDIKAADWSEYITPFWPAVVRTLLSWKAITSVIRAGWKAIKGALAVRLLIEEHKKGLMKFAIITCRKPH
ncbi:hypothetical protein Cgig2_001797 [Carnegiea gigantea]|uniref:Methyltransferase type 11 domain-containing protein n=1 Tax=Carnegiea gigantea TaxID=171969 RepID=A0A9Q1KH01_9CARY|nr:hypothetical protein Cgig2_001797 [Carnegiea gigantea]